MTFLLSYWKQLAGIALILIIFLFGWYKGNESKQIEFDLYKQAVEREAYVASALAVEQEKRQETISKNITKGYADAITKLNKFYAANRVRNPNTSSSEMSSVSETSAGTPTNSKSNLPNTLIEDCATDVTTLLFLQQWVKEQYEEVN